MTVINSQGTNVYVGSVPLTPYVSCDDAIVYLRNNGYKVLCPQILSEIKEFREINEYMCLASDQPIVSAGELNMSNVSLQMMFDPDDIDGQEQIKNSFRANTSLLFGVVIGKATMLIFQGLIMSMKVKIEQSEAIRFDVEVFVTTTITECGMHMIPSTTLSTSRSREGSINFEPIEVVARSFTTSRSRVTSAIFGIGVGGIHLLSTRSRNGSVVILPVLKETLSVMRSRSASISYMKIEAGKLTATKTRNASVVIEMVAKSAFHSSRSRSASMLHNQVVFGILHSSRDRDISLNYSEITSLSLLTTRTRETSLLAILIEHISISTTRTRTVSIVVTDSHYDCDILYDCDVPMLCGLPMPPHSIFYCGASFDCDVPMLCYNTTNLKEN